MNHKRNFNYLLAFGHLCSDINQGALAAVLPFLIAAHHYDYATAASLVMVSNIVGSVVQPLFGELADKTNRPWLIALGLLMAGGGMSLTGIVSDFYMLCFAVMISGTGIAMFHPQAARLVNCCSSDNNRGQNISIFSFGGNLGFTIGPVLTTAAITWFGLIGTLIFIVPEIVICVLFKAYYNGLCALNEPSMAQKINELVDKAQDQWGAFIRLTVVVFSRSIIFYGFNTFLALYWIKELGQTETLGNIVLSAFFAVSAISTLIGGKLADRFGCRKMIRISFAMLAPAVAIMTFTHDMYLSMFVLLPIGCALSLSYSPIVVLGQEYLPNRVGLSSGITLGLAVSVGGIFAPILGKIADTCGLITTFRFIAIVAMIPLIVSWLLPSVEYVKKVK